MDEPQLSDSTAAVLQGFGRLVTAYGGEQKGAALELISFRLRMEGVRSGSVC